MEISTAAAIERFLPNSEVVISSPFPQFDTAFYQPRPVVKCNRRRLIFGTLQLMKLALWRAIKELTGKELGFLVNHPELQDYLSSDLVIDLSGDMQTEDYGVHVAYSHYLPLLMALTAKKPLFLCAQSIGPFKWTLPIARFILRRGTVTARDSITLNYLNEIGVKGRNVSLTADMAFLLEPVSRETALSLLQSEGIDISNKRLIGVSLSNLVEGKYNSLNPESEQLRFKERMAAILDTFCKKHDLTPLFISHVTGPSSSKNDRLVCQAVADLMETECLVLKGDHTPQALKGIIGCCSLFIGARMHANIAALSSFVPTVAIAYSHKTPGIMKMFNQSNLVCDIKSFTKVQVEECLELAYQNAPRISEELERCYAQVKQDSSQNIEIIQKLLD